MIDGCRVVSLTLEKRKMKRISIVILLFAVINVFGQKFKINFNEEGEFKIVQFTDIHWESGLVGNKMTTLSMEIILDKEKPDLVVLTGDIVTLGDVAKGWSEVVAPMVQRKINWVVVLGNHDSEEKITRKEVYDIISSLKFNLTRKRLDTVPGVGNFSIPILSSDNKESVILYFFDSHAYSAPNMPGKYDWIKHGQQSWYRKESTRYTQKNNYEPLPSVAFFHIPLPEYKEIIIGETTIGQRNEGIASPRINSGLFSVMLEQRDIMGIFVGHNHNNDFIGIHDNIALAYGRCSGSNAYGNLRIGARVIELFQDEFHFDSWIVTASKKKDKFIYPSKNLVASEDEELLPSVQVSKILKSGVSYHYYEGEIESVHEISKLEEISSGIQNNFSLSSAKVKDHFAFCFDAYLKISTDGMYQFYIDSDDGSILYIDDKIVVDNDGGHGHLLKKGIIGLKKGYHNIKLIYFEDCASNMLEVGVSSFTIRENVISDQMLFTE